MWFLSVKTFRVLVCLLMMSVNVLAQEREMLPVDWNKIRKEVEDNPQRVKDLVSRLSAVSLDTTLTYQDRILAFYGQSFLTNDKEELMVFDMDDQKRQGKLSECIATSKKILDINPLNLKALNTVVFALYTMKKDSTLNDGGIMAEDIEQYANRAMRIYNTIAMTGDGSQEHPFYVTKVSDEYSFMRYYLDLWEYKGQAATTCCDIITLAENSDYYQQPTIYFEITRVYELERIMFKK